MSEQPTPSRSTTEIHSALKDALTEILPDMLRTHAAASGPVPQVPAPPVAAVHRPSSWAPPPSPATSPGPATATEPVRLRDDRDLDAFVRHIAQRCEDPNQRAALRAGQVRFTLNGDGSAPAATSAATGAGVHHGAVTERVVERAAASGGVLIIGVRAVITPLGRDRARSLGVQIQRENH